MTTYAHHHPTANRWTGTALFRAGASAGRRLASATGAGLRALQYARMVSVMNQLPDNCLNEAGLRRSDIPEHVRRAIYGNE